VVQPRILVTTTLDIGFSFPTSQDVAVFECTIPSFVREEEPTLRELHTKEFSSSSIAVRPGPVTGWIEELEV
jgi:hypothetical protein